MRQITARISIALVLAGVLGAAFSLPAAATPVCAGPEYLAPPPCPRVFAEPELSTSWTQFGPDLAGRSEFIDGTRKLASLYPRYIRVRKLSEILGDPYAVSVGLDGKPPWDPTDSGDGLPIYVVEVTDFTVPDTDKVYSLFTAVHSAEPCGREAYIRTPEDIALAVASGASWDNGDLPGQPKTSIRVSELLKREKLIFLYNSPDGWRSGDTDLPNMLAEQGSSNRPPAQSQYGGIRFTYSEENGRGVNTNRMAPAIGWNFRQPPAYVEPGQNPIMTEPEGISTWNYVNLLMRTRGKPLEGALDIHGTVPTAQIFSADSVADPRQNALSSEQVQRISVSMNKSLNDLAGGVDVAGASNSNAPTSYAQWTSTGTSFDTINYVTSGDQVTWLSQLGTVTVLIENNCVPGANAIYLPATHKIFIDSARAGIRTFAVQTLAAQGEHPRLDTRGRVGYVVNPWQITSAANPSKPPSNFPNNPYFPHGFTQTPYAASQGQMFDAYSTFATRPFVPLTATQVASGALSGLDTLVIANTALPDDPGGAQAASDHYFGELRRFVQGGGNLVLTDRAVEALSGMSIIQNDAINAGAGYVGYIDIQDRGDALTTGLNPLLRQTYDPTTLGYQIRIERDGHWRGQPESGTSNMSPIWMVDRTAWEHVGGKTLATSDPLSNPTSTADEGTNTNRVSLGTLTMGKGRIVFIGALLPPPTDRYPHWFGVNGYAPTALGHHLFQQAVTWSRGTQATLTGAPVAAAQGGLPFTSGGASPALPLTLVILVLTAGVLVRARRLHRQPVDREGGPSDD